MKKNPKLILKITGSWLNEKWGTSSQIGKTIRKIISTGIKAEKTGKILLSFQTWQDKFATIYPLEELNEELFAKHAQLMSALLFTFAGYKEKINGQNLRENPIFSAKKLSEIMKLLEFPPYFEWLNKTEEIITLFQAEYTHFDNCEEINFKKEDLFTFLYQDLIANTTRHSQGEFYTHPVLARLMAEEIYHFGDRVLDPSCGSGTFLLEIAHLIFKTQKTLPEKLDAFNNLQGIDINPIACIMARVNLFLVHEDILKNAIGPTIIHDNFLFPTSALQTPKLELMDIIIGNPPWIVLNRITSKDEKARIKALGNTYGILLGGKLATSTELTTIFIVHALHNYLKSEGMLFFVTPASLATAGQHALFRQFTGMKKIEFWAFSKDVFRIHNLCFKAIKGHMELESRVKVRWRYFECKENPITVKESSNHVYYPATLTRKEKKKNTFDKYKGKDSERPNSSLQVGRLIPFHTELQTKFKLILKDSETNTLQVESPYKAQFRQGASLVPRNLLLIEPSPHEKAPNDQLLTIQPSSYIQSKKYSTWEFKAFDQAQIESQYCFTIAKSTGLIPFHYKQHYSAFLPLEETEKGIYEITPPKQPLAQKHYQLVVKLYQEHMKSGAQISTLIQRINYGKALTDPRQFQLPKIVYNGIGSIVKAAIITTPSIIDTSLYFFVPQSLSEAYYLLGILNSPNMTKRVKLVGSTGASGSLRNIHKHPLTFHTPQFNAEDETHIQISAFSREIEQFVATFVHDLCEKDAKLDEKPKTIQNRLFKNPKYLKLLEKLDKKVDML